MYHFHLNELYNFSPKLWLQNTTTPGRSWPCPRIQHVNIYFRSSSSWCSHCPSYPLTSIYSPSQHSIGSRSRISHPSNNQGFLPCLTARFLRHLTDRTVTDNRKRRKETKARHGKWKSIQAVLVQFLNNSQENPSRNQVHLSAPKRSMLDGGSARHPSLNVWWKQIALIPFLM